MSTEELFPLNEEPTPASPSSLPMEAGAKAETAKTEPQEGAPFGSAETRAIAVASPATAPAPAVPAGPPAVRIFGIGNAGVTILQSLIGDGGPADICVAVNCDAASLAQSSAATKISIESKSGARPAGAGGDPARGRAGAESMKEELAALCRGVGCVILVCGMGGGAGTGAAPAIARIAKDAGAKVLAIAVMPFECEGTLRSRTASNGCEALQSVADMVWPFENDHTLKAGTASMTLLDTFKTCNGVVSSLVRCALEALTANSLMGMTFFDICATLRDRSEQCVVAAAEATGQDRAAQVAAAVLKHPALLGYSGEAVGAVGSVPDLSEAEAVSLFVVGGADLGIAEVNQVVHEVSKAVGTIPLMMGTGLQPKSTGRLSVVMMLALPAEQGNAPHQRMQMQTAQPRPTWPCEDDPCPPVNRGGSSKQPQGASPEQEQRPPTQTHNPRVRKSSSRMRQAQLQLDVVSKGRFDKSEPTIIKGEDLDVPTYVRRGISLN